MTDETKRYPSDEDDGLGSSDDEEEQGDEPQKVPKVKLHRWDSDTSEDGSPRASSGRITITGAQLQVGVHPAPASAPAPAPACHPGLARDPGSRVNHQNWSVGCWKGRFLQQPTLKIAQRTSL